MSKQDQGGSFLDKFTMVAARIGNQVHLRSLRDAFATMMPLYILAGIAVLVNNVVFPLFLADEALASVQVWGTALTNGTLNVASIVICGLIGYCLAANRRFDNPLACVVVSLSALLAMMPMSVASALADGSGDAAEVTGALIYGNIGVNGLFGGIIIGLIATEVFIRFSSIDRLKVNLGEGVPPAVSNSFNVLIPMLLSLSVFGILAAVLKVGFNTDLIALIKLFVQEPLKALGTSLPAVVLIYSVGNFLFTLGIHQSVINGVLLEPVLTVAISENMQAAAAGLPIPNNITINTLNCFGMMGGTGCTIALIVAAFLFFRKSKSTTAIASMSALPGLFNINEPVIFGFPIVFNIPMMIPFVLCPAVNIVITYFATALNLISPSIALVPWTTPPVLSGLIATGGDVRAAILQVALLALNVAIYVPFMRISERVAAQEAELEAERA